MNWLLIGLIGLLAGFAAGFAIVHRRTVQEKLRADLAESELAAAQAQVRGSARLAEIGALTGGLAHEIKNPLSTIGLNLQLLEEDLVALDGNHDRLRNRLATVQRETTRLRETLDDFLRFAGKLELDRRPVDIQNLLSELVDFFAPQAQLQRVQMRLRSSGPLVCDIDPKAVKQAVLNLMINAVQAMSQTPGGELILSASPAGPPDTGFAVIDVIDTGPGIPADVLDKIFHAYYSTKPSGTGLGLAMSRRIAEEHGGSLTVRSEPGKGSDFSLLLPLSNDAPPPAGQARRNFVEPKTT